MVRINKFLAQCNLGSRRFVENIISAGYIKVNDKIVNDLSLKVDPERDVVKFKNNVIEIKNKKVYIMLNKPAKYLVTKKDDFKRKTVFELIPDFGTNMHYIGRLDYMSTGLLLMTNDGDFAQQIIHPRNKLPKLYKVSVKGYLTKSQIEQLRKGVTIAGKKTSPAIVFIKKRSQTTTILKITIFEGRKRQIRHMIKSVGSEVLELKRLQIGNLKLGKLPLGSWRFLTRNEIDALENYKSG